LGIQVKQHIPDKNKLVPDFAIGTKHRQSLRMMMLGAKLISRIPGVAGSWSS
jgi:hypothetical protein